jgi:hypothetical protein
MWRMQHDHWNYKDVMQEMVNNGFLVHLAGPEEPYLQSLMDKWLDKKQVPSSTSP